ncbi:MAG: glutamate formiminotransferase [Acidimicrobiaceae bacterium]
MLECVINISEGRRLDAIEKIRSQIGHDVLDIHSDYHHHRSVFTLATTNAARQLAELSAAQFDLRQHVGVHPRIGIIDVVPFVPLENSTIEQAVQARNEFAEFAASELKIPSFVYGPERDLPEIRKRAFIDLIPDFGPHQAHPTAGAICVGARQVLVAYNIWLKNSTIEDGRRIAREIRSPQVRTLGLQLGSEIQVSMNLISPDEAGPDFVFDEVAKRADISRAELVGLVPARVLTQISKSRWGELDLSKEKTIEWCLAARNRALQNLD